MKILIITAGRYPVPAVKGGAVATLVEHLIEGNSNEKQADLIITSPYDSKAVEESKKYKNCTFEFIKIPKILRIIDRIIYKTLSIVFSKKNIISANSVSSFYWFVFKNSILLKKNSYDYVVIENTARLFLCLKLFGNRTKYKGKVFYHLHNKPVKKTKYEDIINECKGILCVSEYVKNYITTNNKNLYIKEKEKVKVLYNCIDTAKFQPISNNEISDFKKKLGLEKDDRVILFSGRIDYEKGTLQVLESLNYIRTNNIKLLIVGSSFYGMNVKTSFEEKISNLSQKNKDRVIFTGFLNYSEMPLVYNICDIAVLPSICDEAAGLTIIEAMACEKVVITTDAGGITEYTDTDSSIILERDKQLSKNIAENVDDLLPNKGKMISMGKNGRNKVQKYFDSKSYINNFISVIKDYF